MLIRQRATEDLTATATAADAAAAASNRGLVKMAISGTKLLSNDSFTTVIRLKLTVKYDANHRTVCDSASSADKTGSTRTAHTSVKMFYSVGIIMLPSSE